MDTTTASDIALRGLKQTIVKVDEATRNFLNNTNLGSIELARPKQYPEIKRQYDAALAGRINWYRMATNLAKGGAAASDAGTINTVNEAGIALAGQLNAAASAAKSGSWDTFTYYTIGSAKIGAQVALDVAQGAAAIGKQVIAAGSFLTNKWVLIGIAALFFLGPQIAKMIATSRGKQ